MILMLLAISQALALLAPGVHGGAGQKFDWQNFEMPVSEQVPPPWTPVQIDGSTVDIWNRRYRLGESGLPVQIESGTHALLSGAVSWIINDEAVPASAWKMTWRQQRPDQVTASSIATIGRMSMHVETTIEFDGFATSTVKIDQGHEGNLQSLSLRIPIRKEIAQYLNFSSVVAESGSKPWSPGSIDRVLVNGAWRSAFVPVLWLGDEARGFAWCADSTEGWATRGDASEIEVITDGDAVCLLIHFIQANVRRAPTATIRFGWIATPSKPLPSDWRRWHFILETNEQRQRKQGNISILWHSLWAEALGSPRPHDAETLRALVRQCHDDGYKAIPYIALTDTMATIASEGGTVDRPLVEAPIPEMEQQAGEWNHSPCLRGWSRNQSAAHWGVRACPRSNWSEFLLFNIDRLIREYDIDGLYIDNAFLIYCDKASHGCGYVDANGQRHVTNSLFAQRELYKRLYQLFIDAGKQPIIMVHSSTDMLAPCYSFVQATLDGEQFNRHWRTPSNFDHLIPLDLFRAHYHGGQFGINSVFLPSPEFRTISESREHLAHTLLHDVQLFKGWLESEVIERTWAAFDKFDGSDDDATEFVGYWVNQSIRPSSDQVLISYWAKSDQIMMVAANLSREDAPAIRVMIDAQQLGNPSAIEDVVDQNVIQLAGNEFTLNIPARDFRLVSWRRDSVPASVDRMAALHKGLDAGARVLLPASMRRDSAGKSDVEAAAYCEVVEGIEGNAIHFLPGNGGYLRIPSSEALQATSAMALELWLKAMPEGVSIDDYQELISKDPDTDPVRNGSVSRSYRLAIGPDGAVRFELTLDGRQVVLDTAPKAIEPGVWTHLAAVYEGNSMRIYINGIPVADQPAQGRITHGAGPLHLGNSSFAAGYRGQFVGCIDEVRLWNRARYGAEIKRDMKQPLQRRNGLMAEWLFNEE